MKNYQRPDKLNKKQVQARKEFAVRLGVQYEELDELFCVTVQDGDEVVDVNVQANLEEMDKENEWNN